MWDLMAERTRFGPAGVPPMFRLMGADLPDVPRLLREEGLDALEYEAVRWGPKPQISQELATRLGAAAKENDVKLSLHGSYYINLSGKRDVVEASKRRLIASAIAADWMGAYVMVFHTGFYGRFEKDFAFKTCLKAIKDVSAQIRNLGLKVQLGPETMGRKFQVGSLDEILMLNQEIEGTQLVIDWAHMHAIQHGALKTVQDFRAIAERVENALGTEVMRGMHCHFSKIEFSLLGEKKHHPLGEETFGPDFRLLAEVIADFQMHPTMICESPILDVDARKMKETLNQVLQSKGAKTKN